LPATGHDVDGVRIGDSAFGLGLFATRRFAPEEPIGAVRGRVVDDPEYGSDYCMEFGDGLALDPAAPFRYLNHSCRPNCALYIYDAEDDRGQPAAPELWVEALVPIEPGEQLTIDYGWPAEAAIPCACGSPNCRGWIVAEDEAHRLPARPGRSNAAVAPKIEAVPTPATPA